MARQERVLSKALFVIGRGLQCDVVLSALEVSRAHAALQFERGSMLLTDNGSSNGTFLLAGGQATRLQPRVSHEMSEGETFKIGPHTFTYHIPHVLDDQTGAALAQPVPPASVPGAPPGASASAAARLSPPPPPPGLSPPVAPRPPLPTFPPPESTRQASLYRKFLPDIFQENDFLGRFLLGLETLWEPGEQRQDHIAMYFDPRSCPAHMVRWLAGWFGLEINPSWPESRQRDVAYHAVELLHWRGTEYGLVEMIRLCTGVAAEIQPVDAKPFVFLARVRLPDDGSVTLEQIDLLVRKHKPAHMGYMIEVVKV
jgi:phage tail-like protein